MKIMLVGVYPPGMIKFRGKLIEKIIERGHEVVACTEYTDDKFVKKIENHGAKHIGYRINRTGLNPFGDLRTLVDLINILKTEQPDRVLFYTIKPVIWGGIAAQTTGTDHVVMITGLGHMFQEGDLRKKILKKIVIGLYKLGTRKAHRVIFQNSDNRNEFIKNKIVDKKKCEIINGSGVDTCFHSYTPIPVPNFEILMVARLLGDKGVREFVKAAELVKAKLPNIKFKLVGTPERGPDAIPKSEYRSWHHLEIQIGYFDNLKPIYEQCSVYVLPSYHEGLPRTVLEAMSTGRPIITTNAPGCRELVLNGKNGYLVNIKDSQELAEKIIYLYRNQAYLEQLGKESRRLVESHYSNAKVHNELYHLIIDTK